MPRPRAGPGSAAATDSAVATTLKAIVVSPTISQRRKRLSSNHSERKAVIIGRLLSVGR